MQTPYKLETRRWVSYADLMHSTVIKNNTIGFKIAMILGHKYSKNNFVTLKNKS